MYRCAICGKEYEDADQYLECSQRCTRVLSAEKERKRKEKLSAEKDARFEGIELLKKKIEADKKTLDELRIKFIEDYPEDRRLGVTDFIDSVFKMGWW